MVKVALQLSGRLRFTESSLSSLIGSIVETLQPDVFCSFWTPTHLHTSEILNSILKPKVLECENQQLVKPYLDELFKFNMHANLPSMSYKFHRVSSLRRAYETVHNINYDVVIQARTDNIFYERLTPTLVNSCLDNNCICCVGFVYNPIIDDYINGSRMVDNFYFGPARLVDTASNTFWYLKNQAKEWADLGKFHEIRIPEIIQSKIWQNLGIKIGELRGAGPFGNWQYDIDRSETKWY